MLELPEAVVIARQLNQTVKGMRIISAVAAHTPHKLTWYNGDPQAYNAVLAGAVISKAEARGGMVDITAGEMHIVLSDGAGPRYHGPGMPRPVRH